MRTRSILLALALLAPLPVSAQDEDLVPLVPFKYRAGVERALLRTNDKVLRATFATLGSDAEKEAWAFLLANLPPEVADELTEAVLTDHVRTACQAWRQLPWAEGVPKEVFLHWVLPPGPGGTKPTAWRRKLYDELVRELVSAKARDLEQAALAVNRYVAKKVKAGETFGDPASPAEILARGHGRPEERAIFYVAAARAVGVPARVVTTPYWTFRAGGGRWCEVWTGGDTPWHFLGAGEAESKLDRASFAKDARRAAVVLSRTIGRPASSGLLAHDREGSLINSVGVYGSAGRVTIEVKDDRGKTAVDANVALYIFNDEDRNAFMRGAVTAWADGRGKLALDLGPGDYFFHARDGKRVGWAAVRSVPGKTATCAITVREPAPDDTASYEKTGTATIRLFLGSGGGGDMTATVAKLGEIPWKPFGFVGGGGQAVELDPGWYAVMTSWRRSETSVVMSIQVVEIRRGETVTLRTPNFPKGGGGLGEKNAYLLTYPRR
jgi:hypothetical protein